MSQLPCAHFGEYFEYVFGYVLENLASSIGIRSSELAYPWPTRLRIYANRHALRANPKAQPRS